MKTREWLRTIMPRPTSSSNRQLIEGLRDRHPSAVEELISRYFERIQRFLSKGEVRADDSGELIGDIFTSIIEGIRRNRLRDPLAFHGFIWTIARRRMALYRRDAVRREKAAARRTAGLVLASLPERDRQILMGYYLGEQTPEQLCRTFQLSSTQLRMLMVKARASFSRLQGKSAGATADRIEPEAERYVA